MNNTVKSRNQEQTLLFAGLWEFNQWHLLDIRRAEVIDEPKMLHYNFLGYSSFGDIV